MGGDGGTTCSVSSASQGSITVMFGMAAEDREVLGRLVARPVAGGEARQGADDLDVEVLLGDRLADEVVGPARREHRVGGGEGHRSPRAPCRRRRPSGAARPCPSGSSGRETPWRRCAGRCTCRDRRSCRRSRAGFWPVHQRVAERGRLGALAHPDRFYQMGMAEQLPMSAAAGMAREGFQPLGHHLCGVRGATRLRLHLRWRSRRKTST